MDKEVWASLLRLRPPRPDLGNSGCKWLGGWKARTAWMESQCINLIHSNTLFYSDIRLMSQLFLHITVFRMRSSQGQVQPFKSQLIVERQERVECSLWGEEELLWQVKEVKYLRVLFMSAERKSSERLTGRVVCSLQWCRSHPGLLRFTDV